MKVFSSGMPGAAKSLAALRRWWDQLDPWAVTELGRPGFRFKSCQLGQGHPLLCLDKGLTMAFLLLAHKVNKGSSGKKADSPSGLGGQLLGLHCQEMGSLKPWWILGSSLSLPRCVILGK